MRESTDQLNKLWHRFYKEDLNGNYSLHKDAYDYSVQYNKKEVYRESIQHVEAVCKLMRIPVNLWLVWVVAVLEASNGKNPLSVSLEERIKLFRELHKKTIAKYFLKPTRFKIKTDQCPACGKTSFKKPFYKFTSVTTIAVVFCNNCGLGIRYPRGNKENLSRIYEENYFSGNSTDVGYYNYSEEEVWRIKKAENYLNKLEELLNITPKNTNVLDIGSGFGYFLNPLKQREYSYLGIELSQEAVNIANNKFKTKTIKGELLSLYKQKKLKNKSYDLITIWDVIEHFYDFTLELNIISKLVKTGGFIALRTNNINSIEYEVFGKDFHSIKNEHTFYYSEKILTTIFKKVKIKPFKIWSHTHMFLAFMTGAEIDKINRENRGGDIFYVGQKYA